jgi:hypothetical protein
MLSRLHLTCNTSSLKWIDRKGTPLLYTVVRLVAAVQKIKQVFLCGPFHLGCHRQESLGKVCSHERSSAYTRFS